MPPWDLGAYDMATEYSISHSKQKNSKILSWILIITIINKYALFSAQSLSGHEPHLQTKCEDEVNLISAILKWGILSIPHAQVTGWEKEMGTSRKQFKPTSTTFHLSSSKLWQAANKQHIAYHLCFTQDPRNDKCKQHWKSYHVRTPAAMSWISSQQQQFPGRTQCNSLQTYSLMDSFSIFNHRRVASCNTMEKKK